MPEATPFRGKIICTRSIKTLLIWAFLGLFTFCGLTTIWTVHGFMKRHSIAEAEKTAQILLDHNLATHNYFTDHLKPGVFELLPDTEEENYFDPRWMSSTYAIRMAHKQFQALNGKHYYYKESAIDARNPENEADPFEKDFILNLNKDPDLIRLTTIREFDGKPFLHVLRRGETIRESCLKCHGAAEKAPSEMTALYGASTSFGRKIGETVSAISIRIPLAEAFAEVRHFSWKLSLSFLLILIILLGCQFLLIQKMIFMPLKRIRDKARQITRNKDQLGKKIEKPFGKELREVTGAFNNMSSVLKKQMDSLEKAVDRRTRSLKAANERLRESENQYRQLAYFDPVTKLPNRALFLDRLEQNLAGAQRNKNSLGVIFMDLDGFKKVNDTRGHDFGDLLLREVGRNLLGVLRGSDTCARFGGDEFTIILRQVHDREDVVMIMEKILGLFSAPFAVEEEKVVISASIGASIYPEHGQTMDELLEMADQAMYAAKRGGKARFCLLDRGQLPPSPGQPPV